MCDQKQFSRGGTRRDPLWARKAGRGFSSWDRLSRPTSAKSTSPGRDESPLGQLQLAAMKVRFHPDLFKSFFSTQREAAGPQRRKLSIRNGNPAVPGSTP